MRLEVFIFFSKKFYYIFFTFSVLQYYFYFYFLFKYYSYVFDICLIKEIRMRLTIIHGIIIYNRYFDRKKNLTHKFLDPILKGIITGSKLFWPSSSDYNQFGKVGQLFGFNPENQFVSVWFLYIYIYMIHAQSHARLQARPP